MKVLRTRKEHKCSFEHCCYFGKTLQKGSIAVTQVFKNSKGYFILHFHTDCYVQSISSYINGKVKPLVDKIEEREAKKPKGKRGRPPKTGDPQGYRRLKALLTYHKKAGNVKRVEDIEAKIKELEVAR